MDLTLLVVTLVSLLSAIAMALVTWRIVRDNRRRSNARVAALAAELARADPVGEARIRPEVGMSPALNPVAPLFAASRRPRPGGRPATVLVAGVLVVGSFVAVAVAVARNSAPPDEPAAPSRSWRAAPLELVSLRHTRQGDGVTVTGLVRNPTAGSQLKRVSAVVLFFDDAGMLVSSGHARLDFSVLRPGDESPFVVELLRVGPATRYRVSFRDAEDQMLAHIDRRAAASAAD